MGAAQEVENLQEKLNWHWRNSMRPVRFGPFDARAAIMIPVLIFYARLSTLILTIIVMAFFRYLEQKGLTFPAALRNFRAWLVGRDRPGWSGVFRRSFKDFG